MEKPEHTLVVTCVRLREKKKKKRKGKKKEDKAAEECDAKSSPPAVFCRESFFSFGN